MALAIDVPEQKLVILYDDGRQHKPKRLSGKSTRRHLLLQLWAIGEDDYAAEDSCRLHAQDGHVLAKETQSVPITNRYPQIPIAEAVANLLVAVVFAHGRPG